MVTKLKLSVFSRVFFIMRGKIMTELDKLVYKCNYDKKECKKIIPELNTDGILIQPQIDHRFSGWKICEQCERNRTFASCFGILDIKRQ